jgi:hypothetical protein
MAVGLATVIHSYGSAKEDMLAYLTWNVTLVYVCRIDFAVFRHSRRQFLRINIHTNMFSLYIACLLVLKKLTKFY